jgi:hypothetical protein
VKGGTIRVTSDSVVGISGKGFRVFGASITSGAGGGAVVAFKNGTSTAGTTYFQGTGTASKAVLIANIPKEGLLFPGGLFVDVDANTDAVAIMGQVEGPN